MTPSPDLLRTLISQCGLAVMQYDGRTDDIARRITANNRRMIERARQQLGELPDTAQPPR